MKPPKQSNSRFIDALLDRIENQPPTDQLLLRVLFFGVIFSGIWLLFTINQNHSAETPIVGGTLVEGIIGTPRFINPALALSRADQDVTALVYDSLMKISPEGTLVNDAAESITVSEDGLTYNIVMRKDLRFHDDRPLTARDVIFTIQLIQNPDLKSPLRGNWTDVTIEEVNEYEFNVVLKDAYAAFKENFLVGIMPVHLWGDLTVEQIPFTQLNTTPIGAGQFFIKETLRDEGGLVQSYILDSHTSNPNPSNIETIELQFFSDEAALLTALKDKDIDASAYVSNENISSVLASNDYQLIAQPLPRIFGIFLNQNRSGALRDPAVREALTLAIDNNAIVAEAVFGQGVPIATPVIFSDDTIESLDSSNSAFGSTSIEQAKQVLKEAGWIENNVGLLEKTIDESSETLVITLRTSNAPLFDAISKIIVRQWEAIGVEVVTEQYEQTGLVQSVIRPRDFQSLLFGLDMSRSQDLYPFWHSSQKDSPGLNIAQYTNLTVDRLLQEARIEQDSTTRTGLLKEASKIIQSEQPAIFLYQPNMTYLVKNELIVTPFKNIGRSSDRFSNINTWYTDSDTLWTIFNETNQPQ